MRLEGIGTLRGMGEYWQLAYEYCDHHQEFAAAGLERSDLAAREVRRHYARCRTCAQATQRVLRVGRAGRYRRVAA
jgi:hypothetical protein